MPIPITRVMKLNTIAPNRAHRLASCLALSILFGVLSGLRAEVPEPDNVVYGVITLGVTPATAASTNVIVEVRKTTNGSVIASYRMGANPVYGNFYSLEIPLEAFTPLSGSNVSRVGALLYLSVRDQSGVRDTRSLAVAQRGQMVRMDFTELDSDGDRLPDRWESQYFGSATAGNPNADTDGDGRNNLQEFIDGTNPLISDGRHPADNSPADNLLTQDEADAYANAWLLGDAWPANPTNIPIAFVSRAAALALNATAYIFTNAPATNAPMWWVSTPYIGPRPPGINVATSLSLPANPPVGAEFTVTLSIAPTNTVTAYAVQDSPPPGWTNVLNISHGGFFDAGNRLVKWGPFSDNAPRDLTYDLECPTGASNANAFAGIASFDGFDVPVTGARIITISGAAESNLVWSVPAPDGAGPQFLLAGSAAGTFAIESSTNLLTWTALQTNNTTNGAYLFRPPANSIPQIFFRARKLP